MTIKHLNHCKDFKDFGKISPNLGTLVSGGNWMPIKVYEPISYRNFRLVSQSKSTCVL